jgi:hypothetical protein
MNIRHALRGFDQGEYRHMIPDLCGDSGHIVDALRFGKHQADNAWTLTQLEI